MTGKHRRLAAARSPVAVQRRPWSGIAQSGGVGEFRCKTILRHQSPRARGMRQARDQRTMTLRRSGNEAAAMEIENDATARRRLRHHPLPADGADQHRLHVHAFDLRSEPNPELLYVFPQLFDGGGRIKRGLTPSQCRSTIKRTRPIHHTGAAPNSVTTTAPPDAGNPLPPIATPPHATDST